MLAIGEVKTSRERKQFVRLPWAVNKGDPNFVPPLIAQESLLIDTAKHPFYRHGEGRFFLAERDGRVVGRIAAIRDLMYEELWKESCGFFGFYETTEEGSAGIEVTRAMLAEVRKIVAGWGLKYFHGPACPSGNYNYGVLTEGFDSPPRLMMPHNPRRYDELLLGSGLTVAKNLLAFHLDKYCTFERIRKVGDRIISRNHVNLRTVNMKKFWEEVAVIKEIYNDAWKENWGFSPVADEEFHHLAVEMKPLLDPDMVLIAEISGKPAAFALAVPDFNEAQIHLNGRLMTPWALAKTLFLTMVWPKLRSIRIILLGVKKEYRTLGLGIPMYRHLFETALIKGYRAGEASWILEDNKPMVAALEAMGGRVYKKYRIYRGESS